jgi:hypothetical protein
MEEDPKNQPAAANAEEQLKIAAHIGDISTIRELIEAGAVDKDCSLDPETNVTYHCSLLAPYNN